MSQLNILKKPSRLDQARDRLDSALTGLEQALADGADFESAVTADQLTLKLEEDNKALKERNHRLDELNNRILSRLDAVIVRLKSSVKS